MLSLTATNAPSKLDLLDPDNRHIYTLIRIHFGEQTCLISFDKFPELSLKMGSKASGRDECIERFMFWAPLKTEASVKLLKDTRYPRRLRIGHVETFLV